MCMSVEPEHETCPHTSHTRFKSVPRAPLKKERDCKSLKGKIVQIMALNSEREQSIANRDRSFLIDWDMRWRVDKTWELGAFDS